MTENGNEHGDLRIDIERFGPGPEAINELSRAAFLSQAQTTASRTLLHERMYGFCGSTKVRSTTEYLLPRAKQDHPRRTLRPKLAASTTERVSVARM